MTGIPGSPGVSPAALMPVADLSEVRTRTPDGTAVQGGGIGQLDDAAPLSTPAQAGSTRETLSFAACTILDLLERVDAQPARNAAPLLPSPPSSIAITAALRVALSQLVGQSGMFYESHLAEWVRGVRPLSALRGEPQAMLWARGAEVMHAAAHAASAMPPQPSAWPFPTPLLPAPSRPPTAAAPIAAGSESDASPQDAASANTAPPLRPGANVAPATTPVNAAASTALATPDAPVAKEAAPQRSDAGHDPKRAEPTPRFAAQTQHAAQAYEAMASDVGRGAHPAARSGTHASALDLTRPTPNMQGAPAAPVHPASEGLVRGQLELLANQQFRWAGEAWPGAPMAWEVQREREGANASALDQYGESWTTRLRLGLPNLGAVEARLTLNGTGLEARIITPDGSIASQMNAARSELSGSLAANGLVLMRLAIETGEPVHPGVQS